MDHLLYEPEAYYIFDRGYVDYERLYRITKHSASFVVRAKTNLRFKRMYSLKTNKDAGVKSDQIGKLTGFYVSQDYPEKLRLSSFTTRKLTEPLSFFQTTLNSQLKRLHICTKTAGK